MGKKGRKFDEMMLLQNALERFRGYIYASVNV